MGASPPDIRSLWFDHDVTELDHAFGEASLQD